MQIEYNMRNISAGRLLSAPAASRSRDAKFTGDPLRSAEVDSAVSKPIAWARKHEIAYLYEIFIQWSETQMYYYEHSGDDRMFNVQGP